MTSGTPTASVHLLAVLLPVSARRFVPPHLEAHHGADQIHHHGDEEEDDGGGLARLRAAEGAVHAAVEDRVGAEPPAGRVPDVDDAWWDTSGKQSIFNPKLRRYAGYGDCEKRRPKIHERLNGQ